MNCSSSSPFTTAYSVCFKQTHLVNFIIAIVGTIMLFILNLLQVMLIVDLNPISKVPFAGFQSRLPYMYLTVKVALPLLTIFDHNVFDDG